ncbi:c-type cytochrome biogenesis protein CcsB [Sciscionella sediminilitoris]|uniref:c-type cytochrome biogenesis protein CcsB n=1 Tax=Sciscionella sediminilitoris TaxID=1445613 RepID=UPI0004DEE996|nr:c-type cytochrome biogenesis protein CcsB [Sciscionella sp. SE31]
MAINATLSQFSDYAFATAIAIYVFAFVLYLADVAFNRQRARARERELVPAGAGEERGGTELPASGIVDSTADVDVPEPKGADRPLSARFGRMGVALTVLGLLVQAASIVLRGLAVERWPLGNMYEYIAFITAVGIGAFLVLAKRFPIHRIGAWVLLPVIVLMWLGATVLYANAAPVMPALQSYWLVIHVTIISASTGLLLVPGVASLMYLLRSINENNPRKLARFVQRLPAKDALDRVAYRTTIFAFPLYTVGVICGAIWAERAWGSFWSWDPKETVALVAWVVYAIYLHARSTAGWRGNPAAAINSIGFVVTVFNLFFINLVTTGMHSYAGVS